MPEKDRRRALHSSHSPVPPHLLIFIFSLNLVHNYGNSGENIRGTSTKLQQCKTKTKLNTKQKQQKERKKKITYTYQKKEERHSIAFSSRVSCSSSFSVWISCLFTGLLPISAALSYVIGSVPSLSGHAIAYRWRSLPRAHRHRASKPQGSSKRVLPWQDHHGPINMRLSFPHPLLVRSEHVESTGIV